METRYARESALFVFEKECTYEFEKRIGGFREKTYELLPADTVFRIFESKYTNWEVQICICVRFVWFGTDIRIHIFGQFWENFGLIPRFPSKTVQFFCARVIFMIFILPGTWRQKIAFVSLRV